MSFIEDNDLHAEYAIGVSERFKVVREYSNLELAKLLILEKKNIDKKFKNMTLDISNKVVKLEPITEKQRNALEMAYVYNFEIDRDYFE